ncbi:ketosteroid isomerase-like protein [Geodermatophilus bullaregiensis]|uniref:YybH family protein n=1 Tax=Geodermatophilus bullaregiensis TaxID=1564160 RepID=UPI00195EC097|nr:nuclear transport factor 2 family protein [Geodermatophilus bullaregiensis]MBM7808659.1 ketosteroid isomerase-like protein [Geodermatophilus bullaregiensis]
MASVQHGPTAQGTATRDEQRVRAVIEDRDRAVADRDAERFVASYTPSVVVFDLAPPLRRPAAEVLDPGGKRAWMAGFEPGIAHDTSDLTVTVDGDVAVAHGLVSMTATPKGSARGFTVWFRATLVLRRSGDTWLVTHEHVSTPFHMDGSFRAAVDLVP